MSSSTGERQGDQIWLPGTVADRIRTSSTNQIPVMPFEVSAARVGVIIDRRLGRQTPMWIKKLAEATPHSS
ncbi:hypothetical protein FE374_13995 [Georgenia yuyongxinii]|uniref:Uncharacterized protein n=1 Tax=Georgenia yuyongxinii TaxID=2589797 RepID=A0A5B8CBL0_9MICO|nr:hypothetical protein [Georgenia yuyongxinii]QDC25566.1 hypothetical protein FE374_13995 [Georgenia yuyongxinii]